MSTKRYWEVSSVGVIHEDERRALSAIFNGDFTARQVKIIRVKQDSILGGHYHSYREVFYVLEGMASYTLVDIETKERQVVVIGKGNRLMIQPLVAHRAAMAVGTIMIEATEEPYISAEHNDVRYSFD